MIKIKKCPFCGSPSIYKTWHFEGYHGMKTPVIFCDSCKVIVMAEDDSTSTKIAEIEKYLSEKVEEAWNTRKPLDNVVEALEKQLKSCEKEWIEQVGSISDRAGARMAAYNYAIQIVKEKLT